MQENNLMPTSNFLPYMPDVMRWEQVMHDLNFMWRLIESSAKMNCPEEAKLILPTIQATRASFSKIQQDVVTNLVSEKTKTVQDDIGAKAKFVIDIVVRNLFERTADIGFLSTDKTLCEFAAGLTQDLAQISSRLRAYRDKYTVYDEIILLDTKGNVLVHVDDSQQLGLSLDPLVQATLQSSSYIETFRASDLRPNKKAALIYSQRLLHPDTDAVVGVLCLCFDFEQEMAGIFRSYREGQARYNMMLLDADNQVIASADNEWINVGATVPVHYSSTPALIMFAGREYLIKTSECEGYQGYMGPPGWKGQIMIPIDVAFSENSQRESVKLDDAIGDRLLSQAASFSPPLHALYEVMQSVNRNQRCVVWNGQLMTAAKTAGLIRLKTVLEQINETAEHSNTLFQQSITELCEMVLATRMADGEVITHLLGDILDRSLYERANDCRWFALTPELRNVLNQPTLSKEDVNKISHILDYINQVYTVYSRIYVYDAQGKIIVTTHAEQDETSVIDTYIDTATLSSVKQLKTSQQYHVSEFAPSTLYADKHCYIYHAAIFAAENESKFVGGVGIIFDAANEFPTMLKATIHAKKEAKAFFVDRHATILASSDPNHQPGSTLAIAQSALTLAPGTSSCSIVVFDDQYTIMACSASNGYREFKVSDGYQEDVIAIVLDAFGIAAEHDTLIDQQAALAHSTIKPGRGQEFANFVVNDGLFALPADAVLEAVVGLSIKPMSMAGLSERIGVVEFANNGEAKKFVWVYDFEYMTTGVLTKIDHRHHVLILELRQQRIGLLVGELHSVTEFSPEQISPYAMAMHDTDMLVTKVIHANGGKQLIQLLDVERLFNLLQKTEHPPQLLTH